jgi:hypothetical protein
MAGRAGRRRRDPFLFSIGKFLRALHRKQRGCLQLWGGRRSDCGAAMDLLLDADFPARGRVH